METKYRLCLVLKYDEIYTEEQMKKKFEEIKNKEANNNNLKSYSEKENKIYMHPREPFLLEEFLFFQKVND